MAGGDIDTAATSEAPRATETRQSFLNGPREKPQSSRYSSSTVKSGESTSSRSTAGPEPESDLFAGVTKLPYRLEACDKGDPTLWAHEVVDALASRRSGFGWTTGPGKDRDGIFGCMKQYHCRTSLIRGHPEAEGSPCEKHPECSSCSVCVVHDERAVEIRKRRESMGRGLGGNEGWRDYIIGLRELGTPGERAEPPFLDAADNRALIMLRTVRRAAEKMEHKTTWSKWAEEKISWSQFHHIFYRCGLGPEVSITTIKKMYRKWCQPVHTGANGARRRFSVDGEFLAKPEKMEVLTTTQVIRICTLLILALEERALHGYVGHGAEDGVFHRGDVSINTVAQGQRTTLSNVDAVKRSGRETIVSMQSIMEES